MAARGSIAKENVTAKILETFEGAFTYEKEIRVPIMENGELVQIKITLTAAKTNVEPNGDSAIPGSFPPPVDNAPTPVSQQPITQTEEEKATVAAFLKTLGL